MRERSEKRWQYIVKSLDCYVGAAAFIAVLVLARTQPKLRQAHLLDVSTGVSVAILAVVLAAFAILVAFLSEDYNFVLTQSLGSPSRAFEPYAIVAVIAGAATVTSVVGLFLWPIAGKWVQALLMATSLGLTAWAVVGSVQLVGIATTQGRHKLRIPEIRAAATQARLKAAAEKQQEARERKPEA
jgi:hypothetical protein